MIFRDLILCEGRLGGRSGCSFFLTALYFLAGSGGCSYAADLGFAALSLVVAD